MGFEKCSMCSKLFDRQKSNLCSACYEIESNNIKKVTDYFQAFEQLQTKSFSIKALSVATGVKIQEIERLYRTNRLRGYTGLFDLDCKLCGNKFKPTLHSGVFCKKCTTKVEKVIKELKESDIIVEKQLIEEKTKDILKPKEKEEPARQSGMHLKSDSKKRCGFKKN